MNQWYYGEAGQQVGPLEGAEILRLKTEGRLQADTLVWREGMLNWLPLGQLTDDAFLAPQVAYYNANATAAASGWAIASMVCGIVSLFMCYLGGLCAIPGVVFGHIALKKINNAPYPMSGRGMAIAGLITGYLGVLIMFVSIGFVVFAMLQSARAHP